MGPDFSSFLFFLGGIARWAGGIAVIAVSLASPLY